MASLARRSRPFGRTLRRPCRNLATTSRRLNDRPDSELDVGELRGAKFRVEPLRRTGEDADTMRARLLYQSRKRGTLESDLLLSTFAAAHLPRMSPEVLRQYDAFLDENDWDIYYWATQDPPDGSAAAAASSSSETSKTEPWRRDPRPGEWAQTVGTFKPAYRPVPERWKDSEVLGALRKHVRSRRAASGDVGDGHGRGMGFMPELGSKS